MRTGTCDWCGGSFEDRSPRQNRRFCSDNCRKRANDRANRRVPCNANCGRKVWLKVERTGLCSYCRLDRQVKRERAALIVGWWAEGLTLREIAAELGWTVGHLGQEMHRLRQEGYDLPLRPRGGLRGRNQRVLEAA